MAKTGGSPLERDKLLRLGALARKKASEGLSPDEALEQAGLRRQYLDEVRAGLKAQIESIRIVQKDGSHERLKKKKDAGIP